MLQIKSFQSYGGIFDLSAKNNMIEKMRLINSQIGEAGASERAAQFILSQKL